MATYEELLDYANKYNPQPQQELGVNSFGGGMIQQEETPYQKMMRETYGNPMQQQEEQGILGSVVNRMSGQPQQQGTEEPSFLGSAFRGAMAQGTGTIGGQADFLAGATGSETLRSIGDAAQKKMQEYSRPHEYTFNDIFGDGLSSVWKYLSDPNGAAYDIGGGLGSTAAMAAEAALLSAALPSSVAAAGTGAVAAFATRLGLKSVAGALSKGGTAAKLIKNVIASTPLEAASESGGTYREMTTDEQGNRINPEDLDMDKVQEAMAKNFVGNLGVLGASNLLESVGIGRLFGDKMRQGILGKVRDIGAFMATNAGQNAWEEGAQTGSNLYAQGKIDNISQVVNPFEWNPEQIDAATIGGVAGFGQGMVMGGAGHVMNKIAGPQQQEGNPAVNIQNKVTNEEFGDAVAIAKHDTSTNLVDRMRNLEGRIGHHASDGTNCARTIGLALAGTDYQDLINVDDFVKIAQNKGQLKDPNSYVPKPGDLAVVNDGNHIVMVSENGGTIQNGSSRDGVYESAQSPLQMFGSVKYYISTSDMSSGDYGVAGNLQGVNEEQRQQEYYKNLVAQESQRRADAIREVLGAKTHEQEQQEQAVSEAQKYQQDNASELGPISNYYNAFTEQELDALTPEQKQTLKNNFDSFYSDKQNWGHTAIEKVQTARGMYNQLLANRQQTATVQQQTQPQAQVQQQQAAPVVQQQTAPTTAPTTNVQQQVAQPTPTQTANVAQAQAPQVQQQATPTTTPTTETAVSPTEKQKPVVQQQNQVVQQQNYKTRSEAAKDLPNRIQKAVTDTNGDYAKLHSALTTEATDLENDLSFGKITQDEYKTAKAQLDEAQNKYLYNKNNQPMQTGVSPDEWEKRLRKATEDLGEAYRNGNITKDEYERRMQAIDDAYDTNVTQKRGVTQYSPAEPGAMSRQAEEQKATDINITKNNRHILNQAKAAKKGDKDAVKYMNGLPEHIRNAAYEQIETPREKFVDMVDELYKKKKQRQSEADRQLITSQANEAFKTGAAMIEQGATAEEAFDAVKDSIGTEKQKAKAKAEAEKQAKAKAKAEAEAERQAKAKKGEKKDAVTEQKPTELQESKAKQGRDKNVNAKPEEGKQQKGENGEGTESKNKVEVKEKPAVSDVKNALQERVNKEFATEEERALAMSVLTGKETPLKALEKRKKENKKRHDQDINDFTEAEYNALQKEGHQGVTLVPLESDPDSGRKKRASNNPKWYQDLYASYGGTPSMAAVRRLAIDVLTGENTDVWADRGVSKSAIEQMEPEFEQKRAELDAIDKRFNDEEALLDSITPGIEKINAEMKKEISKYRREAKKTATQQAENVVQSSEEGVNGQNVDDKSGLRKLSDGNTAGSVQQNEDGRETGNLSGDENGPGEATLQADDGLVQNEESGTARDDGRGSGELSGRATEIRNATDEQDAVRAGNDVEAAQKAYDEELDRITKDFEDGKITEEEAEKRFAEAEDKLNKALEGTQGDEGASSMSQEELDDEFDRIDRRANRIFDKYIRKAYNGKYTREEALQELKELDEEVDKLSFDAREKEELHEIVDANREEVNRYTYVNAPSDANARKNFWRDVLNTKGLDVIDWAIEGKNGYEYYTINHYNENSRWALYNSKERDPKKIYADNPTELLDAILKQNPSSYGFIRVATRPKQAENTDYQAAATQNEQMKRSLDELITEAKKAFKGAKGFRINRNDLIFTMPNGLEMKVNIEDQILLNAADEAKARKEHGLDEGGITVEGYAKRLDKGSLVALSRDSRIGTAFHEAFHTVWDWALNEKEKAAMLKHFNAIAEEQGVSVDEVMADAYRDWLLARQQHKGTVFGKLFQKIKDFINSALTVLTGAENVHNVYRQIESGKVWNRDAKGRFATEENAINNDKKFLVTNKKITANTQVPVVDITNSPRFKMDNAEIKKAVLELMNDKNNEPIKIEVMGEGPIGRVASIGMGEHIFNSSERGYQNIKSAARLRALSKIRELLESAIYVEKHPDAVHGRNTKYIELYAVAGNKNNNTMTRFRVVAKEGDPGSGKFEVSDVKFYDIIKNGIVSADPSKTGGSKVTAMPSSISVAQLLDGVKDKNGKPYVVNGKLQYEPGVLGSGTKYSVAAGGQKQEFTSEDTSLKQVAAVFKKIGWKEGTTNIDIGGGKYDLATDYLKEKGVKNVVFDPFNRSEEHNRKAFEQIQNKGDTVTVANVLNVIKEDDIRDNVILQAAKALKPGGKAYFAIYTGNGSGAGKNTTKGWQNNRKTAEYLPEIAKRFKTVKKSGDMIIASDPIVGKDEKALWLMSKDDSGVRFSVRQQEFEKQKEDVRKQYKGTKQWMKAPNGEESNLNEDQWVTVRTPAFKDWFGDWENDPRNASKIVDDNGEPLQVYHGTVAGEFDTFDRSYGSVEGDMGAGFYFTNNERDVKNNYEGGGPDFEIKVERLAEQIAENEEVDYDEARKMARDELFTAPHLFELYLNMRNPANVANDWILGNEVETEELDRDDYDSDEDFEQAQYDAQGDAWNEIVDRITNRVEDEELMAASGDVRDLSTALWNAITDGGLQISHLKKEVSELYPQDADGNFSAGEIVRIVVEELGYDGIVDSTVSRKFRGMDLNPDTVHYIAFEPNQVKDASGRNTGFDKGKDNIYFSIRPSDTPLQRTQKLQAQADRYNAIELNAVTAKDPTARKYMRDQIVKRQLQGLTKKAEKAEAKKRAEKYADDLLEKLDEVVTMVEKVAKRFPAMQDWQNRPIVTITKEERERLKKEKAFRNDVMYRVIDENGKVEPVVNAFKNNAEYPINMDFGTLCMKKEAIDAVVQILVDKDKGQNLGPTQNEMLKDLLREFGYAVPCDVCFVETKRERMLPDANKTAYAWESVLMAAKINDGKAIGERTSFTEKQEKRLKEMAGQVKGKTFKQAYEEYMPHDRRRTKTNGDKGTDLDTGVTSTATRKLAKLFLEDPALAGKLEPTTIITSKGTDDLIRIYGGHTNIKNVLSGLYGSANAKPIEGFSVYDALSWILMDSDAVTKDWDKLIDMGGGRVQSFSDYNPLLFLEYIQMVVDYQARNMPMHAYTKVPMFARLFGKTGIMINMSFVPEIIKDEHDTLDEKGKLVHAGLKYNPKTGKFDLYAWHKDSFPIEEALEIRKDKGYAKHVGTIAVGVSDEHIKKMMADPEIDMIIPYHKSGMPAAVQNKTGLKYAKDYTDFQNPGITDEAKEEIVKHLANGDAKAFEKKYGEGAESYLKNRYLNYSRLLVKEGTPEKAAQEYLNRCKDLGCTPVFEMFAYKDGNKEAGIVAPGYYKMLEDFRGYDSEMNPIMQGPVRLYSTDENGEKHLNLPDNVEELLTDSLADRTAQLESLEQLKNNKEFWRKADKLMEMQRADGEVRKAMVDRLSSALGSQNVKTLENGAFLDELEKLYRENGMSEESAKEKVEMFRRLDGAVYGFAKGGAIYLNENYFNANTPAHEFTHIWAKVAQTKNKALWKKGVDLLEKTEEWNKVVKDPLYENIIGNKDAIASEVLARIVGKRNADFVRDELLDPAKKQGRGEGLWAQIREWMKDIFKSIRSIFDPIKGRRLTYDEFTKMPLKALWDTSEHEQFRESLNELAQQQERADEVHADAIELQAEGSLKEQKQAVREQYEGTDKWMKAPNGKPTNLTEDQWVTTQTPQFKEWFGDSKVVDENGEPLVVYHGTNADIESFDTSRGGEEGTTRWGKGAYFATGIGTAETYAKERAASGGKENIIPCFLKISNLFDNEMSQRDVPKKKNGAWQKLTEFLEQNDVDLPYILENSRPGVAAGIAKRAFGGEQWAANAKFREKLEEFGFDGISAQLEDGTEYVVFNANQIKDAAGNNVSITKDSDNIHYSITSTLGKAINKADAYANRNVRKPNENTATGRAAKAFNNTQNKNNAQTFTEWLKDRFTKFYREWIDKNDAIHEVDAAIEKITGKKLAEEDKLYNMVQGARAYANGAAQTLVEGTPEAFRALRDSLERGIDPKDKVAMDRVNELKKDFKYATMQQVLEPIMTKDMDEKYPSYLEKHGLNNWHDAFSNYLGARRILELVRLVENKSLEFITHDKKEFTDFIDRHPEYEYFRPKAFAKGTWRTQVQKLAQANPKLAEQMAKDLAKQYKFPNGVTRADLEALVAEAPKEFNTSAQVYYQLQRNTLTLMELGHLIPQAVHDQINKMYKEYCPLMIDYSDTAGLEQAIAQFGRGADSIANVGSMLKQVLQLGSERGLISPLESSYKAIQALTERAERNKVAVHFVKTVANSKELQKSGILQKVDKQHSPDAKNCIFTVLIDGKRVAFKTTQDLYGPIVGYDMPAAGIVEGFCRSAAQTLRYGATTSPSFIIRNFIRDTIFAGVSSRNGFVPVLDSARGLWAYLYNQELRGEFDAMGITAYNYFGSGKNAVKSMDKLMGEKDWNYLKSHPTELIKELIKYIPKKFEAASEAIEASTRMGEYMKARKAGKSMQEAALDARDVTLDFSRSGFYGQRVNMMVPFFNACLQGGDKFFKRMVFSKDPAVRMQTARMVGLYIMLPSAILWFFNHDEPWYEELDPHIKMNNWIIGGVRIPKPQEAGITFGSGIEAMLDKIYNKDPKAGKEWVTAMREVLVPNLIPTVGLPLLEWWTNYSLFREKAIEGNRLKRLPTEMRYNSSTTEVSKWVGSKTGLSPVKLDNTVRGYTGTLGMLLAQAPDILFESKRSLPSRPITERAMVRDFFLNDMNMNRTSEEFYELVNTAQQQHAGYGKKGKPTPAVAAVNKALRDVSKQQKEIHMITDAKNISPDRKRQMIDRKREIIRTIQKKTLQRYRDKFNV